MSDFMDEGEGVPVHTPTHSPAHSQIHSPTLQKAANVPTAEQMRALMATVADLTLSVAQTNAQQAQNHTTHARGVGFFWRNHVMEDGAQNFMVSRRVSMAQGV